MRDFYCRNCFKKSKAEWDGQVFCRRPNCIDKDDKMKPNHTKRVYTQSGTGQSTAPSHVIGAGRVIA